MWARGRSSDRRRGKSNRTARLQRRKRRVGQLLMVYTLAAAYARMMQRRNLCLLWLAFSLRRLENGFCEITMCEAGMKDWLELCPKWLAVQDWLWGDSYWQNNVDIGEEETNTLCRRFFFISLLPSPPPPSLVCPCTVFSDKWDTLLSVPRVKMILSFTYVRFIKRLHACGLTVCLTAMSAFEDSSTLWLCRLLLC